jgi:hypothetical protein
MSYVLLIALISHNLSSNPNNNISSNVIPIEVLLDDVLVHSKELLQHLAHLKELFKRLHKVNMKIHPKKCEFVVTLVVYLGHKILPNGIMAHWAKVVAILEMPNPIDVHTLRSFIKLCNYYKNLCPRL